MTEYINLHSIKSQLSKVNEVRIDNILLNTKNLSKQSQTELSKCLRKALKSADIHGKSLNEAIIEIDTQESTITIDQSGSIQLVPIIDKKMVKIFRRIQKEAKEAPFPSEFRWKGVRPSDETPLAIFKEAVYQQYSRDEQEYEIPLIDDKRALNQCDRGRSIQFDYHHNGTYCGTEIIDRIPALENYRQILEGERDLHQEKGEIEKSRQVQAEITKLDRYVQYRQQHSKQTEWVKSQDFRNEIAHSTLNETCDRFPFGAPVNLRVHQMQDADGSSLGKLVRLGAITHPGMGWFSLEDLEAILLELEGKGYSSTLEKQIKILDEVFQNPKPYTFIDKMKFKLLGTRPSLRGERLNSANKAQLLLYEIRNKWRDEKDLALLRKTIEERQNILKRQMLQYVSTQVAFNSDRIEEGKDFNIFHISLLNQNIRKLSGTGWMHDESVAIRDFRRIMREFNGKTLVFGDKGPVVDGDTIHFPAGLGINSGTKVPLNTFFFNITPQGNRSNEGLQLEHNNHELGRLRKKYPEFFNRDELDVRNRVQGGKTTGYTLAEDFAAYCAKQGDQYNGVIGLNCASGKDRTGFVAARLMLSLINKLFPDQDNPFLKKILDTKFPLAQVVKDNLPNVKIAKIHPKTAMEKGIPGYSKIETISFLFRQAIEYLVKAPVKKFIGKYFNQLES